MQQEQIMVSICCITYNQEEYIRDAIEGFLKQKTNFKYEIIIHDDASTDNTPAILKEYEGKYKDKMRVIYQKENQYSKGRSTFLMVMQEAKGKYIAVCEGDDYWIDENKLQLQVDYMEKNPECTFLFHNAKVIDMQTSKESIFVPWDRSLKKYIKKDEKYNVGELELLEFIPTASYMVRTENIAKLPEWFEKCFVGDWPLKLIMTSFGYAHYMDKIMSVYRKDAKGSITAENEKIQKESDEGKKYILSRKEEFIEWIDEFTNKKYADVFDIRRRQYKMQYLLIEGNKKRIF